MLKPLVVPDTLVLLSRRMAVLQARSHVTAVKNDPVRHDFVVFGLEEGLAVAACTCGWQLIPVDSLPTDE